jgi:hypothetical protein
LTENATDTGAAKLKKVTSNLIRECKLLDMDKVRRKEPVPLEEMDEGVYPETYTY